jgi:hypothetical protein
MACKRSPMANRGTTMPSPDDSDDLDAKAEKYRDQEFDRQYSEYEARLHAKPPIWRRAWFYAAIAIGLVFVLYIVFTLTTQPLPP